VFGIFVFGVREVIDYQSFPNTKHEKPNTFYICLSKSLLTVPDPTA